MFCHTQPRMRVLEYQYGLFFFFCIIQQGKLQRFVRTRGSKGGGEKKRFQFDSHLYARRRVPLESSHWSRGMFERWKTHRGTFHLQHVKLDSTWTREPGFPWQIFVQNSQKCRWKKTSCCYDKVIHWGVLCNKKHLNAYMQMHLNAWPTSSDTAARFPSRFAANPISAIF